MFRITENMCLNIHMIGMKNNIANFKLMKARYVVINFIVGKLAFYTNCGFSDEKLNIADVKDM